MVCDRRVTITMQEPAVGELAAATETLARWQDEGAVMQLHPGDIGWFGFLSMMGFLGVLTVGFIYEWRKGALDWE